jgi:hypothetical protein
MEGLVFKGQDDALSNLQLDQRGGALDICDKNALLVFV